MVCVVRGYCEDCDIYFLKQGGRGTKYYCPKCEKEAKGKCVDRNTPLYFEKKQKGEKCGVDALHVENVRWSEAMGCNPDQIPEFKKKWPWMEFDKEGRCRVGSRHEKLRIMKARGFTERG